MNKIFTETEKRIDSILIVHRLANKLLQKKFEKYPYYAKGYISFLVREDAPGNARSLIEDVWSSYEPYADSDFIKKFKSKLGFEKRLWEIYAFGSLSKYFIFEKQNKKKKAAPDFKIKQGERHIYIECVGAGKGKNKNRVETMTDKINKSTDNKVSLSRSFDEANHPKVRRILNSLDNKQKQFNEKHKVLLREKDVYIIAICASEIEGSGSVRHEDNILEAVLGINPAIHIPQKGPSFRTMGKEIPNSTGTQNIPIHVFKDEKFKEISAVLFCGKSLFSQMSTGVITDEIIIVHNPYVVENRRIDLGVFTMYKQVYADIQSSSIKEILPT